MNDMTVARVKVGSGLALNVARGAHRGGTPFVLIPGYTDSWWSWSRVLPALAAQVDVIAVDPRGHGDSDRPACCYRVDDHSADVVALLDALDISRAILVGHSGSCFVARRVALAHPERVGGLGLIASPVALDQDRLRPFVETIRASPDPVPEAFVRDFQLRAAYMPLPPPFVDGLVMASRKMPARVWRDELDGLLGYRDDDDIVTLTAPTTLIWGDQDATVPREHQDALARAIPAAQLFVLPDTGHSPNWERPDAVVEILLGLAARVG